MSRGGHLGEALSALVDGELDHEMRDRALGHVTGCPACRGQLEAERRLKAGVRGAFGPLPPGDLTRRLLALAEPGEPLTPRVRSLPGATRPAPLPSPARYAGAHRSVPDTGSTGLRRHAGRRARRGVLLAAGAVTIGGGAVSGVLLASQAEQGAPVRPPIDTFLVEPADVTPPPLSGPTLGAVQLATFGNRTFRTGPGVGVGVGVGVGGRVSGPAGVGTPASVAVGRGR